MREAGVEFTWLNGHRASGADWDFFHACYRRTYREHHSTPYLSRAFFDRLASSMPDNVLLVIDALDGKPICATLNIHNHHTLYGRY